MGNKRDKSDSHSLLHAYRLTASECRTVKASSDLHIHATLRLRKTDYARLCTLTAGDDYEPIIALFSTQNAREPVQLRSSETIFVHLKLKERNQVKKNKQDDTTPTGNLQPDSSKEESKVNVSERWQPLTVTASHAYVKGMRVTGTIHRSIVRLNRYI